MDKRRNIMSSSEIRMLIKNVGQHISDKPSVIHIREVVQVTIKNIVVINGKEVEVKDLPDAELLAEKLNRRALTARNYTEEKTA